METEKLNHSTEIDEIELEKPVDQPIGLITKNDHFFTKKPSRRNAAWQRRWFEDFEGYADKYHQGAKLLYETASNTSIANKDEAAYPIMFLARHCIELRLKSLLFLSIREINHEHSLCQLWNKFDENYCDEKDETYKAAHGAIMELHQYDCHSDTFRYPMHKDMTPTAKAEFIDIDMFYQTFEKLNNFLEDIEAQLQAAQDYMA